MSDVLPHIVIEPTWHTRLRGKDLTIDSQYLLKLIWNPTRHDCAFHIPPLHVDVEEAFAVAFIGSSEDPRS